MGPVYMTVTWHEAPGLPLGQSDNIEAGSLAPYLDESKNIDTNK